MFVDGQIDSSGLLVNGLIDPLRVERSQCGCDFVVVSVEESVHRSQRQIFVRSAFACKEALGAYARVSAAGVCALFHKWSASGIACSGQ